MYVLHIYNNIIEVSNWILSVFKTKTESTCSFSKNRANKIKGNTWDKAGTVKSMRPKPVHEYISRPTRILTIGFCASSLLWAEIKMYLFIYFYYHC